MNEVKNARSEDAKRIGMVLCDLEDRGGLLKSLGSVTTVKIMLKGWEVLMVLQRTNENGIVEVAYVGSESLAGCCRKLSGMAQEGKVKWLPDRWANGQA